MLAALPGVAHADENGISFWVPGFFGSLAATPQQPGPSGWNAWITFAVSPPGARRASDNKTRRHESI